MAFGRSFTFAIAFLLLSACRSSQVQFHTLTPADFRELSSPGGTELKIELINVPPMVDRQQIVIRESDSKLVVLENQWWAASLTDEMRSALAYQFISGSSGRKNSVRLDVQRFETIPGKHALIDVRWRLRQSGIDDTKLITCRSILTTQTGPSIDETVIAHQSNLKRLANEISQAAEKTASSCPFPA